MEKHDTLLIASGSSQNRTRLREILENRYHLLEAASISQMKLLLQHNINCICAILIDTSLRAMDNKAELLEGNTRELLDLAPVIVFTQGADPEEISLLFRYGASDVLSLTEDSYAILHRVETIAELHLYKQHLESMVHERSELVRQSSDSMVDALSSIIEYRSVESGNHILRVRYFTRILMEEVMHSCPEYGLTDRDVAIISSASALHDIGKIAIPDAILMKPGALTESERVIMNTHTTTGCRILNSLNGTVEGEYLRYAHNICHYHHERWDGKGYPEGLSGDSIPICAQAVGLADAYDALTSARVYKGAYSFVEAVNMILKGECGLFSPKLLQCFKNVTDQFEALTQEYSDGRPASDAPFDITLPAPAAESGNALEQSQAMYHSLIHYLNAFVVEVDLEQRIFHVIYNPYPEVAPMLGISTLEELTGMMLDRVVVAQDRNRLKDVLFREIPRFMKENMRRSSFSFHYQNQHREKSGLFEMTLLRPGISSRQRSSLVILCRMLTEEAPAPQDPSELPLPAGSYLCRNDQNFTLVRMGENTMDLGGYSPWDIHELFQNRLSDLIHPDDRAWVRSEFDRQLEESPEVRVDHRILMKNGKEMWVSNKSRLSLDQNGQEFLYSSLTDISSTKAELEELRSRMDQYEVILAQTENVLFQWDMVTDTIDFSRTWETVFGQAPPREQIRDLVYHGAFFHPDDTPRLLDSIAALENGSDYEMVEVRIASPNGRYLWFRIRASARRNRSGVLTQVMGIIINIDVEKQAQRALLERADRDSLTKLLNKAAGRKQAESYLSRYSDGVRCAMLILDLDDFKKINDQYGHLFGDSVLTKTARTIEKHFQAQDIIARIGGDEFLILVRGVADRNLLENRCRQLISALQGAVRNVQRQIELRCSIGIALAPEHGKNYYELFAHADQALYQAKAKGKNMFCIFEPENEKINTAEASHRNTPIDSDREPGLAEESFVRFAFQKLYSAKDMTAAVNEVIGILGQKMNVSRVYVFENTPDNRFCNNTFEWCNQGITPEIDQLQMISYDTDIPGYSDNFNEQGIYYCPDVSAMEKEAREIVEAQGIKSMLQCAFRQEGIFRGYIGFDECSEARLWTKEEIAMLSYFSDVLSVFIQRLREHERQNMHNDQMQTILDNQTSLIYMVDPDTFQLQYLNRSARVLSPHVQPGAVCYQALIGKTRPCSGCPVLGIREKHTARKLMNNAIYGAQVLAEATMVQWQGSDSCLMTCHLLTEE